MGAVTDGYVCLISQSLRLYLSASLPSLFLEHGFGRQWVPWNQQYPSKSFQNGTVIEANLHATQNEKPRVLDMSHAQNTSVTLTGHLCLLTKYLSGSNCSFLKKSRGNWAQMKVKRYSGNVVCWLSAEHLSTEGQCHPNSCCCSWFLSACTQAPRPSLTQESATSDKHWLKSIFLLRVPQNRLPMSWQLLMLANIL